MDKEKNTGKSILSTTAAAAAGGMILYAVGHFLSYLFRDVDPARQNAEQDGQEAAEDEEKDEADKAE